MPPTQFSQLYDFVTEWRREQSATLDKLDDRLDRVERYINDQQAVAADRATIAAAGRGRITMLIAVAGVVGGIAAQIVAALLRHA